MDVTHNSNRMHVPGRRRRHRSELPPAACFTYACIRLCRVQSLGPQITPAKQTPCCVLTSHHGIGSASRQIQKCLEAIYIPQVVRRVSSTSKGSRTLTRHLGAITMVQFRSSNRHGQGNRAALADRHPDRPYMLRCYTAEQTLNRDASGPIPRAPMQSQVLDPFSNGYTATTHTCRSSQCCRTQCRG